MFDVVGMDTPNIDLALNVETFPKPDGFTAVDAASWQGGGKVSTGMVAAARLGAKGAVLGTVGDDAYGRFIKKDFECHGIDTAGLLVRENSRSNMAVVLSDRQSGGRSVVWTPGDAPPLTEEEIPSGYLEGARYFFMAYADGLTLGAAQKARAAGASVVMDADSYAGNLSAAYGVVDVFIASEFVYEALFSGQDYEAACREMRASGPGIVVFTLGSRGCVGLGPEGFFTLPAYKVKVADTVGAGDVFHGAFIAGLLQGWPTETTARFASAVSAIKCTRIGGRAGIPDKKTALTFMETGEIDYTELDRRVEYYSRGLNYV